MLTGRIYRTPAVNHRDREENKTLFANRKWEDKQTSTFRNSRRFVPPEAVPSSGDCGLGKDKPLPSLPVPGSARRGTLAAAGSPAASTSSVSGDSRSFVSAVSGFPSGPGPSSLGDARRRLIALRSDIAILEQRAAAATALGGSVSPGHDLVVARRLLAALENEEENLARAERLFVRAVEEEEELVGKLVKKED